MPKTISGIVSSIAGEKSIVVTTHWRKTHPIYKKQYKVSAKYMAHDEKNETRVGDKVIIEESKPISARKRYMLKQVIQKAELTEEDKAIFKKEETTEEIIPIEKQEIKKPEPKAKPVAKKAKLAKIDKDEDK